MYRGLNLSRVIFCINDSASGMIKPKSGFGDDVDHMLKRFQFRMSRGQDLFHTSLAQGRDMFIDLEKNPAYVSKLPVWYKQMMDPLPTQFIISPVLINSFPAGFFYGDVGKEKKITRKLMIHMNNLRFQAAKSLKINMPRARRR